MNQIEWMLDTLQEAEEQLISSSSAHNPRQQERQRTEERSDKGKEQKGGETGKRPREYSTPGTNTSMKEFKLKFRKRARIHMDIGKESPQPIVINLSDIPDSFPNGGQSLPTTPISKRQQFLQVSTSTNVTREKEETVFDTFREIKIRNEILKKSTCAQFWKQSATSQGKLLSVFDSKNGKMHMAFLEAQTTEPKTIADYKQTFDVKNVHPIDQLEMHKKIGEIVSSTLTNTSMSLFKMQVPLSNYQSQLKT